MKSKKTTSTVFRIDGLCAILFFILALLKVTGIIDWTWLWVSSPLWVPLSIIIGGSIVVFMMAALVILPDFIYRRMKRKKLPK